MHGDYPRSRSCCLTDGEILRSAQDDKEGGGMTERTDDRDCRKMERTDEEEGMVIE